MFLALRVKVVCTRSDVSTRLSNLPFYCKPEKKKKMERSHSHTFHSSVLPQQMLAAVMGGPLYKPNKVFLPLPAVMEHFTVPCGLDPARQT